MRRLILLIMLGLGLVFNAHSQDGGSLSTFSPYTMYGIGDLAIGGTLSNRLMGGIGIAVIEPSKFNYQNPASLSAIPRNSALFNIGATMNNYYSQTKNASTSYNSVDLHDLGFAIPLYRGIGLGFSLTPVSSVGYKSYLVNNNSSVVENIGRAVYGYVGEGGISQVSMNLGVRVWGGLSLGASMNYYFGSIDRYYSADITSFIGPQTYRKLNNLERMHINQLGYTLGFQYMIRTGKSSAITIGGVITPQMFTKTSKLQFSQMTSGTSTTIDTLVNKTSSFAIKIPTKYGAGIYYSSEHFGVGFDYIYQNWEDAFDAGDLMTLKALNEYRFGAQYTPDANSVRSALNRWTYKLGGRYSQSYLSRNGVNLNDWAISFGVDIPLKAGSLSVASVGFEVGQRGTLNGGQILDTYFRVFAGVSLFGDDMWFVKRKFN